MRPTHDPSRDLLFGLLALQNGMVNRDQLVAAFGAWTVAGGKALAELLVAQGGLLASRRALLEALAAEHMAAHGGDPEKSLAALEVKHSTRESLARIGGLGIETSLARVGSGLASSHSEGDSDLTADYSVGTATSDGQRFRVLRPHAKGGLGAVFVALDSELNREVALKQILDSHAHDTVSRQRFLLRAWLKETRAARWLIGGVLWRPTRRCRLASPRCRSWRLAATRCWRGRQDRSAPA